ncbi:MAG: hypothetical protein CMJ48_14105 [Planctomycetaceae bacterium]|nr:hypothetical protein [Planctomycetaceae bacterium]
MGTLPAEAKWGEVPRRRACSPGRFSAAQFVGFSGVRRSTVVASGIVFLALLAFERHESDAGDVPNLVGVVRTPVAADRPDQWPDGEWVPVQRSELAELLKSAGASNSGPQTTSITQAKYEATFAEDSLRGGSLEMEIAHDVSSKALIPLDPLNLAMETLEWSDGPAVWGTTRAGSVAVLVDRKTGTLHGKWSLSGRRVSQRTQFDVRVAPATVSQFIIHTPAGRVLSSPSGAVVGPVASARQGWVSWTIFLSSREQCRIQIGEATAPEDAESIALYEQDTSYVLFAAGLQIDTKVSFEVFDRPASTFNFRVPDSVEITSITLAGETRLRWNQIDDKQAPTKQILVSMPDPIRGPARPLQIRALAPLGSSSAMALPQIVPEDAHFVGGHIVFNIRPPMELRSLESEHARQVSARTDPAEGLTLEFIQRRADASIRVRFGLPNGVLRARVLNHLTLTSDDWLLESEIEWSSQSGSEFSVRCDLPSNWDVTEILPIPREPGTELANWRIERPQQGRQSLSLEFREAITPAAPRTVRILAQRLPVASRRTTPLPFVRPRGCSKTEGLLAVTTRSVSPVLELSEGVNLTSRESVGARWSSLGLWDSLSEAEDHLTRWVELQRPSAKASFRIRNSAERIDAAATVQLALAGRELTETFVLECQPVDTATDRVLVFLSHPGTVMTWRLKNSSHTVLEATRLSRGADQLADWPLSGELWEIRLPSPRGRTFRITSSRRTRLLTDRPATFLFAPNARSFRGNLKLDIPRRRLEDVVMTGLESAVPVPTSDSEAEVPADNRSGGDLWRYDSPKDSLVFRDGNGGEESQTHHSASLYLESRIAGSGQTADIHVARFIIQPDDTLDEFSFTLPSPARLISVTVGGIPVAPLQQDRLHRVPLGGDDEMVEVAVRFSTASPGAGLIARHSIVVPRSRLSIVDCRWDVHVPPGLRLDSEPSAFRLREPLEERGIVRRLFGPFARNQGETMFNPFVERSLFGVRGAESQRAMDFPAGDWTSYVAHAPGLPQEFELQVRNQAEVSRLSWVILMLSLLLGLAWKRLGRPVSGGLKALWLSLCVVGALFLPPAGSEILGALTISSVLVLLCPARLLRCVAIGGELEDSRFIRSTVTAARVSAFLLALWASASAWAQPGERPDSVEDAPVGEAIDSPTAPTVLEPVPTSETVFVDAELLQRLRAAAPTYLISSASYRVEFESSGVALMTARYAVRPLVSDEPVFVHLPITNANLGGPDACRVNGIRHSVRAARSGSGLMVELPAEATDKSPGESTTSPPAEASDSGKSTADVGDTKADVPTSFEIELQLHPATTVIPGGAKFEIRIPKVVSSTLTVENRGKAASIVAELDGRKQVRSAGGAALHAQLGRSESLTVSWSSQNALEPVGTSVFGTRVLCSVDPHPTFQEIRVKASFELPEGQRGQLDFVRWRLPERAIVRKVVAADLSGYTTLRRSGSAELLIEFDRRQTEDFEVAIEFLVPVERKGEEQTFAAPELLHPRIEDQEPASILVGITSAPGFQTPSLSLAAEDGAIVPSQEFAVQWGGESRVRPPGVACRWSGLRPLSFALVPATPKKSVRVTYSGTIRSNQIEWDVTAEVTTTDATSLAHRLQCDSGLQIESVSVQQDGAERLVHQARREGQLVLYLDDETSGFQEITLKAIGPLDVANPVTIPLIVFDDAENVESRVQFVVAGDYQAETLNADFFPGSPIVRTPASTPEADFELGPFDFTSGSEAPQIKLASRLPRTKYTVVTVVRTGQPGTLQITAMIDLTSSRGSSGPLVLKIPAALADDYQFSGSLPVGKRSVAKDGSVQLTFDRSTSRGPMPSTLSITASLPASASDVRTIPMVDVESSLEPDAYLIVTPSDDFNVVNIDARRLDPGAESVPEEVRDAAAELGIDVPSAGFYRVPRGPWQIEDNATRGLPETESVPLLISTLWPRVSSETLGRTRALVTVSGERTLEFHWPARTRLTTVLVDGRSVEVGQPTSGRLSVPLETDTFTSSVVLWWVRDAASGRLPRIRTSDALPVPIGVRTEHSLLTIVPSSGREIAARQGFLPHDRIEHAVQFLEGLLSFIQQSFRYNGSVRQDDRRQLTDGLKKLQQQLSDLSVRGVPMLEGQQQRIDLIARGAKELDSSRVRTTSDRETADVAPTHEPLGTAGFPEGTLFGRLSAERPSKAVSIWSIERVWLVLLLAVLGLFVLKRLLRRVLVSGAWTRLSGREDLSVGLIGVLWWVCLRPSGAGIVLLGLAVVLFVQRRRALRATTMTISSE